MSSYTGSRIIAVCSRLNHARRDRERAGPGRWVGGSLGVNTRPGLECGFKGTVSAAAPGDASVLATVSGIQGERCAAALQQQTPLTDRRRQVCRGCRAAAVAHQVCVCVCHRKRDKTHCSCSSSTTRPDSDSSPVCWKRPSAVGEAEGRHERPDASQAAPRFYLTRRLPPQGRSNIVNVRLERGG